MTTRIVCIRHGETDWNAAGRWQGCAPVPLNADGLAQAERLARYLAAAKTHFDVLYSSDLLRARQTAQAIANALNLDVLLEPRLREVDLGDWQGLTRDEAEAWDPIHYAEYRADWYNVPTPNGESRNQLKDRVCAAFDDITTRHPGQVVALVSHGGTLGMLIESLFGKIERPTLRNTSLTMVEQDQPGLPWVAVQMAWTPHMNEESLGETW